MSRWDIYLDRVDEKVSKKEINTALKNDNILIGCEFEFKVSDDLDSAGGEASEMYERALKEWEEYNSNVREYNEEIEEYDGDTQTEREREEEKQERADELIDAIETQEEHNDEIQTNIDNAETVEAEAQSELDDLEEGDDGFDVRTSQLESIIQNAKDEVDKLTVDRENNDKQETMWQDEIDSLTSEISDIQDDIRYRENDGRYEQVEAPYVSDGNMPNYFEYMTNWQGYSEEDFIYTEPGEDLQEPPEWEGGGGGVDDFEQAITDNGMLDSAPFEHYEIGEYGGVDQDVGSRDWAIEPDESLGSNGVEVKNPPLELPTFVPKIIDDMFDWIDDIGYTDSDCGFHCHMSIKNPKNSDGIDFLKLIMFTDEQWIYSAFEERANNHYANSVKDKLKRTTNLNKKDIETMFRKKKLIMKLQMHSEHFDAINLIDSETGHVEFRYMGGSAYHRKGKEVKAMIGMYAHNLALAMDSSYKRKEYTLKLQRVFNKMEMFYLEKVLQAIRVTKQKINTEGGYLEKEDIPGLDKLYKKEEAKYKRLASVYKIDGKTKATLKDNRAFMEGVKSDVLETIRPHTHSSGGSFMYMRDEVYSW